MGDQPTVYVTRDVPDAGIDRLEENGCEVVVWPEKLPPERGVIRDTVSDSDAEGILCMITDNIDREVMRASEDLRVVSTMSVGYDHIDLDAAADLDVAVGHTPGVLSETTADLAWALLMSCARRVVEAHDYVREGEWQTWGPQILTGQNVFEATLGVVGLGGIGTEVAKRAAGFDMDVLYAHTSRHEEAEAELAEYGIDATYVDHVELFRRSDFVSLHVPLTDETRHLVGEDELRAMPDDAILVNTARGEVIDTDALQTALESDWIRRVGLDTTDPEPFPPEHPLMEYEPEKLVVAPHIGSASVPTRRKMAEMAADNVLAALRDEPPEFSAMEDAGYESPLVERADRQH